MSAPVHPLRSPARAMGAVRVVAALVVLTCLAAFAAPAGAHGDEGEMTVVSAEQSGPLTIAVEVGLLYTGDEHLAEEARVWVDVSTPGTQLEPVPLERSDADSAVYSGEIPVPVAGEWSLAFSSEEPAATATATVTVTETPATTGTPTTDPPATTTTSGATTTTEATDGETADAEDGEDSDDGLSAVVIALGTVAVLVLASAAVLIWRRRTTDTEDPDLS